MGEEITGKSLQVLDLMLEFFTDDDHWLRGQCHDAQGRSCLVGAVLHFTANYGLAEAPVLSLLASALPERQLGLINFHDHHCRSAAELRSLIRKARAFALENAEHEQAAAALKGRLLAELERDRVAATFILCPDAPEETAVAVQRLAA